MGATEAADYQTYIFENLYVPVCGVFSDMEALRAKPSRIGNLAIIAAVEEGRDVDVDLARHWMEALISCRQIQAVAQHDEAFRLRLRLRELNNRG